MKVLYISEDYFTSKVHHNLCSALVSQGMDVSIFSVYRKANQSLRITIPETKNYTLLDGEIEGSSSLYKYCFPYKKKQKYTLLKQKTNLAEFDLVHAATLFSEGAIAYEIYKEYHIPYVVAVRNTDVFFYLKAMPHLWKLGEKILYAAQKIFFITPALQKAAFATPLFKGLENKIKSKIEILPNGIDLFWHEHRFAKSQKKTANKLIYVGNFEKVKNLPLLIKAISQLRKKYPDLTLTLVGGGGNNQKEVERLLCKHNDWISHIGRVHDKDVLMELYRQHDIFTMPSRETFGLVYVEALSQGLPILYGKGSGFDGIYPDGTVGYAAEIKNLSDVQEQLEKIITHYNVLVSSIPSVSLANFHWKDIASHYEKIYFSVIRDYS